jgi:hypothetical protein
MGRDFPLSVEDASNHARGLSVRPISRMLLLAFFAALTAVSRAQDSRQFVQQAVQTELAADRDDHSHWLYFETDRQPEKNVKQWVAEAKTASLKRIISKNGQSVPEGEQRSEMDRFVHDSSAQAKQHKNGQHDDEQATELLKILPNAFTWTKKEEKGSDTILHFTPDPQFRPPDLEARVFAAMEGDMAVDTAQHRIVSLKGHLIRDVKFGYGLFGELKAGGTFDVERREIGSGLWQITETHVHIEGHALLFKNISEEEDDEKSQFKPLPASISLQEAETELLDQGKPQLSKAR